MSSGYNKLESKNDNINKVCEYVFIGKDIDNSQSETGKINVWKKLPDMIVAATVLSAKYKKNLKGRGSRAEEAKSALKELPAIQKIFDSIYDKVAVKKIGGNRYLSCLTKNFVIIKM